jgi:hypothetical protein
MGMFGNTPMRQPGDFVSPQGGYGLPQIPPQLQTMAANAPAAAGKPGFDDPGGLHDKLTRLGAHLMIAGGNTAGGQALLDPLNMQGKQMSQLQRELMLAQYKADNPQDTATIRTLQAAGIDPASPQGRRIIQESLVAPHFMTLGNPETGQTVIDANAMGGGGTAGAPAAPHPDAVARLRANPNEAPQFDQIFGPGSAARVLGAAQ